jgi:hypothetical protein
MAKSYLTDRHFVDTMKEKLVDQFPVASTKYCVGQMLVGQMKGP